MYMYKVKSYLVGFLTWEIDPSELRSSLLKSSSALDWSASDPTISYTANIVLEILKSYFFSFNLIIMFVDARW